MTTRVLVVNLEGNQPVRLVTLSGNGSVLKETVIPVGGVAWSDYLYDARTAEVREWPQARALLARCKEQEGKR